MQSEVEGLLEPPPRRSPCVVSRALDEADDELRDRFLAALADERVSANKITLALARADLIDVSATTVRTHRRGECGCSE